MKLEVLRLDQIIGDHALNVFSRFGKEASPTGYAIERGVNESILREKAFLAKGLEPIPSLLNKEYCEYWTSTKVEGTISKCFSYGGLEAKAEPAWNEDNGIRIVASLEELQPYIRNSYTILNNDKDVLVVTAGEYPQDVVDGEGRYLMNTLYREGSVIPTGKTYRAVGYRTELFYDGNSRHFERDLYPEFEYNGDKYVLAKTACFHNGDSRYFWSKVRPIEWIVDEDSGLAITKDCIVGGIPLNRKGVFLGDFDKTLVQDFIDNDFLNDVF
ncbi:MAG: hypothetical protein J6X28_02585 [Bacilli bacterium]|nr:hypothetical protein [Bacilli bacterium]